MKKNISHRYLLITPVMLAPKLKSFVVVSALAATFAGAVFAAPGDWDNNQPGYESIQSISVTPLTGTEWVAGIGRIEVESDGSKYTQPKGQHVTYALHGEAKVSKDKWRIYHIAYGIGGWVSNSGTLNSPNQALGKFHSVIEDVSPQKHVKVNNKSFVVPLGASGLGEYAVARCNAKRTQLMNDGMAPFTVFNSNRDITIAVAVHFAARVDYKAPTVTEAGGPEGKSYWRQATAWTEMPVRCLKSPDKPLASETDPTPIPAAQNFKLKVGVNQATLLMSPNDYSGSCPIEMNASGTIVTNGKAAVKYRFESDKGELSPIYTVQVDQTHTAYIITKFRIGAVKTGGAASTFTAPSGPPSGGQGLSAPKLQATPTQAGVYQGFYRLHIVAPNQLVSAPAAYKVTCTQSFSGPGSVQPPDPQPAPVRPPALGVEPAKPSVAPAAKRLIKQPN